MGGAPSQSQLTTNTGRAFKGLRKNSSSRFSASPRETPEEHLPIIVENTMTPKELYDLRLSQRVARNVEALSQGMNSSLFKSKNTHCDYMSFVMKVITLIAGFSVSETSQQISAHLIQFVVGMVTGDMISAVTRILSEPMPQAGAESVRGFIHKLKSLSLNVESV